MDLSALIDCGANASSIINRKKLTSLAELLHPPTHHLKQPIPLQGFDGQPSEAIKQIIQCDFTIDNHTFKDQYLLAADLGSHDMIIGRKWLAENDVMVDCRRKKLYWPGMHQLDQWDAIRRDQAFDSTPTKVLPTPINRPPTSTNNQARPIQDFAIRSATYQKRRQELELNAIPTTALTSQIATITAPAFEADMRQTELLVGAVTIAELDHILEKRQRLKEGIHSIDEDNPDALGNQVDAEPDESTQLRKRLPTFLHDLTKCFSKTAANTLPPSRPIDHKIEFDGPEPTMKTAHLYKMSEPELEKMREYLIDNLKKGFIKPSNSSYSSPVLFVKKPGGGLRFCIDYRHLNSLTKKDRYPLPLITETLDRLAHSVVFTKLDVRHAFHRILMEPSSMTWAAFRTRYGSFEPVVLPFGLCNGPATFQRYINTVLMEYLDDFCSAYIDDILIFSKNHQEHRRHVWLVLERLRDAGLQVDIDKCEFEVTETKFLGFIVTNHGVKVDPAKVSVVQDWKPPTTKRQVQLFLGFCNFYRRFIEAYRRIA
ncbi:hypothetical protein QTJ16_003614 [Diplocarpon rosae]|uniref:Reverse transcriptase domain-containing protein n=1 Tax=Diplocarpon rosae TaxID=946125 RepID=A0AAD9T0Q0_9HELO|nr:hypothetical protein QTJ16_003614 [Diplocarpon rosae]